MSKTEILQELARLPPTDREEILNRLWELEESDLLTTGEPAPEEKVLLDQGLAAYARSPGAGRPWREVLAKARQRKTS